MSFSKLVKWNNNRLWNTFTKTPLIDYRGIIPPHGKGKINLIQNNFKQKIQQYQYSFFKYKQYIPTAYASSWHNEKASLCARALKETPEVNLEEMQTFILWVKANYKYLFPKLKKRRAVSMEVYLKNTKASPMVKAIILKTHERLVREGITENTQLSRNELYQFTKRKAFIKSENNLYDTPEGYVNKPPRLIQGAQPEFIALVGPAFMSIQAEVKKIWSNKFPIFFTSGANNFETVQHIDVPEYKLFENDVSSYDASICKELCELEVWLAKKFGAKCAVLDLMRANINTHGVTNHGIKYSVKGTRKSGDPYTSLMNSILNGLMHAYCLSDGGFFCEYSR